MNPAHLWTVFLCGVSLILGAGTFALWTLGAERIVREPLYGRTLDPYRCTCRGHPVDVLLAVAPAPAPAARHRRRTPRE
ncbi:hypothetical protein ABT160_13940 [Streptomyces sp. NPDC001941]|uniref:hypothetical protein n=1 Tax=Streptomyces sp. NPDC001941 TaxID=3154659 RepID=UPI003317C3A1